MGGPSTEHSHRPINNIDHRPRRYGKQNTASTFDKELASIFATSAHSLTTGAELATKRRRLDSSHRPFHLDQSETTPLSASSPNRLHAGTPSNYREHTVKRTGQEAPDVLAPTPLPKRASRPKARTVHAETRRIPSAGFELKHARTPYFEGSGPDLSLRAGKENSYRIARSEDKVIATKSDIPLAQINLAWTDNKSRIRLKGPQNADKSQLVVDLEFKHMNELLLFQNELSKSITEKSLGFKEETFMAQIFQKPLASAIKLNSTSLSTLSIDSQTAASTEIRRGDSPALQQRSEITSQQKLGSDSDDFSAFKGPVRSRLLECVTRATSASRPAYVEVEEKTVTHPLRYSEDHGLGPRWQHQLTYGSGRHRATVNFVDLFRLDEGKFLNDQLIDFYLLWLLNQRGLSDRVYMFNTHFFSTLTRKGPGQKGSINYSAVERWTANEDLFGYDYIVVPINQNVHWYVAIICNVSGIVRKPAIDGTHTRSPPNREAFKSAQEPEGQSTLLLPATDALLTIASPTNASVSRNHDETLFNDEPEDSSLGLIDADAIKPQPRTEKSTEPVVLDSDASKTARMQQLSLTERTAKKHLASSDSRLTPKESKRKSGPPVKRWNSDEPTIIVLDSLGGIARSQAVRALKDYVRAEGVAKRGMEAEIPQHAFYATDAHIPVQENFYDCGIYLLGYMQKFFEDPDKFKNQLLLGEMQAESSWSRKAMPQIRDLMRDILRDLYQQQNEGRERAKAEKRAKRANDSPLPPLDDIPREVDIEYEADVERKSDTAADPDHDPLSNTTQSRCLGITDAPHVNASTSGSRDSSQNLISIDKFPKEISMPCSRSHTEDDPATLANQKRTSLSSQGLSPINMPRAKVPRASKHQKALEVGLRITENFFCLRFPPTSATVDYVYQPDTSGILWRRGNIVDVDIEGSSDHGSLLILRFILGKNHEVESIAATWLYTRKDAKDSGVTMDWPEGKERIVSTHVQLFDYNVLPPRPATDKQPQNIVNDQILHIASKRTTKYIYCHDFKDLHYL